MGQRSGDRFPSGRTSAKVAAVTSEPAARRLLGALLLLGISGLAAEARAQPGPAYRVENPAAHPFAPLRGPGVVVLEGQSADDAEWDVPLPFDFVLFGAPFDAVSVGTNGALLFPSGRSVSFRNPSVAPSEGPAGYVAPFWDDLRLYASSGGRVAHVVEGTAPRRRFGVEWLRLSRFGDPSSQVSFRVWLYEGPAGRIDFEYGPAVSGRRAFDASVGLEAASGASARRIGGGCSPRCSLADWPGPDTRRTLRWDAGPELSAGAPRLPGVLVAGRGARAEVLVASAHGAALGPFAVAVRLAPGGDRARAFEVGRRTLTLPPFGAREVEIPIRVPATAAPGRHLALARVDAGDAIAEVDEANNDAAAATRPSVLPGGPNVRAARARLGAARLAAGSTLAVALEVENDGETEAPAMGLSIAVSANRVLTPRDRALAARRVGPLAPAARLRLDEVVEVPRDLPPGRWWLGVLLDPGGEVAEADETDNAALAPQALVVAGEDLRIVDAPLPPGYAGAPYRARLEASDVARWRVTGGALPPGLELEPSGVLRGVPAGAGEARFEVAASRAGDVARARRALRIFPGDAPVSVPLRALPTGAVGRPYRFEVPVVGRGGDAARLGAEGLPAGLALEARTIRGVPRAAGTSSVRLRVLGAETALPLVIRPGGRLRLRALDAPPLRVGVPVDARLRADGGVDPLAFAARGLPPGLSLSPGGRLTGRPEAAGTFAVEAEVRDAEGAVDAERLFVDVRAADGELAFDVDLPPAVVDGAYRAAIAGPPSARVTLAAGRLPRGLEATPRDDGALVLEGVPRQAGRFDLALRARARDGRAALAVAPLLVQDGAGPRGGCRHGPAPASSTAPGVALLLGLAWIRRRARPR
jgi:hypothetical protein